MRTGISLSNHRHRQNRLDLGKKKRNQFNLLSIKSEEDDEKYEQILKHLHPTPPFFPGSTWLPTLLPSPPEQCRGMGNGGCGQSVMLRLCLSFLLTLFPCSSVGSLPWDTVLHELLQCGSFPWAAVLQELLQHRYYHWKLIVTSVEMKTPAHVSLQGND